MRDLEQRKTALDTTFSNLDGRGADYLKACKLKTYADKEWTLLQTASKERTVPFHAMEVQDTIIRLNALMNGMPTKPKPRTQADWDVERIQRMYGW